MCVLVTQSYLTLCEPMDSSPPGSSVLGILQARILEWLAILSRIKPASPELQADSLPSEPPGKPSGVLTNEPSVRSLLHFNFYSLIFTSLMLFDFSCIHALEKEMANHSSILAWKIPGTEEPGGLLSMGSHRVGHN